MSLVVKTIVTGELETNSYIVSNPVTRAAFVIDPGAADPVWHSALAGLHVQDILLTHAHFDHIGALALLAEQTHARIHIHQAEAGWLRDPLHNLSGLFAEAGTTVVAPEADQILTGDHTLHLLGAVVRCFHTPGHTPGHMVYQVEDMVFTGDLVFENAVGRTDLPGSSHEALIESIRRVILPLPDETHLLPGHGSGSSVAAERAFLSRLCNRV